MMGTHWAGSTGRRTTMGKFLFTWLQREFAVPLNHCCNVVPDRGVGVLAPSQDREDSRDAFERALVLPAPELASPGGPAEDCGLFAVKRGSGVFVGRGGVRRRRVGSGVGSW